MDYQKLKSFRFFDTLDQVFTRPMFTGSRRTSLYPSEASVVCTDPDTGKKYIEGGCHTKSWFRMMGFKESNPPSAKSQYIFKFGNYLENMLVELAKQGMIYDNNSVKFWDPSTLVSGEVDLVVRHPNGGFIFCEIKSSYGAYKEMELLGGWRRRKGKTAIQVPGKPSTGNLLQLLTYLWIHRDMEDLVGGKLIYILRDNMTRVEFDVTIVAEDFVTSDGNLITKHRATVNGEVDKRFFIEDMYERYAILRKLVNDSFALIKAGKTVHEIPRPERDYELAYSDEKIEACHEDGSLSDTKYNAFKKDNKERPGDWNCSYCGFKDLCYKQADIDKVAEGINVQVAKPKRRVKAPSAA